MLLLVLIFVGLPCLGAVYQAISNAVDARRFPQRGKLVQAGDIKLNIECSGEALPTVILESAGAFTSRSWAKVQPEVAKFARVISYDRAGYGWSESSTYPRTATQLAKELKALLDAAGEKGPYILVGNSVGGYVNQAFANEYPQDVAGMVLVDASHPDTETKTIEVLSPEAREKYNSFSKLIVSPSGQFMTVWATRLGIVRLLTPRSDELTNELNYLSWQTKQMWAVFSEFEAHEESSEQIRKMRTLGDRPLIVLTAGKIDEGIYDDPNDATAAHKLWVEVIQKDLVRLSTRGKQIVVTDSGHMIPMERPEAVVAAIREVWDQVASRPAK
jgi:pimeloyl-ACP methyl ester carboxylesterase